MGRRCQGATVRPGLRRAAGAVVALALLATVVFAVGPRAVTAALRGADARPLAAALLAGVGALVCWAEAQRLLHGAAGAGVGRARFWPAYAVGATAKLALPAGGAAGPVLIAAAVAEETDLPFERDLAAASAGSSLGVAGAVGPTLVGVAAVGLPGLAVPVLAVVAGLVAVAGGVAIRPGLARRGLDAMAAAAARLFELVPGADGRVGERVAAAPETIVAGVADVAADRRMVALALGLSTMGWCLSSAALVGAALAVGYSVGPWVALAVVPVASVGRLLPVPAGLGGVEAALSALLVATGVPAGGALAVALLHRASTDLVVAATGAVGAARPQTR